ncbi:MULTISPECIES: IclR family transcriptional regulator [Paraburkholderia]|uniref:IclR family transcriptional regulator n=1 Tax=Paraburkholderia TaxID=1822464 RepID=UPI002250B283|nr:MULTISPECIES: IclR family transcriptional regulator C-terminal domain-containing protein [Paraburkholderia]MCX4162719.1 helix-turn-helix domain-containing protein [Paraburkholderia megapolitana]MDN7158214.1 helix-turn-helix domain-containing protein [Paraburkholderia sp. CHISQ3]MDQ6495261.1 helix-turn-helix domain-containing protein [Paraburkholderia megapolitana]
MTTETLGPSAADTKPQRGIQSLDSTGELLAALVAAGVPLTLRGLAAAAAMPPAKAFPHLVSLQKIGLLSRDADGCFAAGPLALELGLIGLQRLSPTREAEAEVVELAASTDMSVAMAVLGPLGPTVVRLEESPRPLHVSLRVGTVMSLVNTAIGRVFAAYIADDVRRDLLGQDGLRLAGAEPAEIFAQSSSTRGAAAARLQPGYLQRLAQIRANGIDTALNKPIPGINTLAAPVFDHTGSICVVIAVMGPAGSFDSDTAGHPALTLLAATQRLSHRFGYMATPDGS